MYLLTLDKASFFYLLFILKNFEVTSFTSFFMNNWNSKACSNVLAITKLRRSYTFFICVSFDLFNVYIEIININNLFI